MRAAILRGDEPPGTLIPIDAVAQFFGVSQIPVREALKILSGEGLVEHVRHVGYSVAKLTFTEFRELYEVRRALEEAALRAAVVNARPEHDAAIDEAVEAIARAHGAGDVRGYHEASRRFHLALIEPSGMARLLQMYESAWNLTEPAQPMSYVADSVRTSFTDEHDSMVAAFKARDVETLVATARAHYDHLIESIEVMEADLVTFRPE